MLGWRAYTYLSAGVREAELEFLYNVQELNVVI